MSVYGLQVFNAWQLFRLCTKSLKMKDIKRSLGMEKPIVDHSVTLVAAVYPALTSVQHREQRG